MKRFAEFTADELAAKRKGLVPKTTAKATTTAANTFREYLKEKNQPQDFENFTKQQLNLALSTFYVEARTKTGEIYKKTSLETLRYGLNRHMKSEKGIDILDDAEFASANEAFKIALLEIKQVGKAAIDHHPPLTDADRQKIYTSRLLSPTYPQGLFNKVPYDIRYYFCRRGAENMHTMTKKTFVVKTDPNTGRKYVYKQTDELTKNHGPNDDERVSGYMPEMVGDERCPVASFGKYVSTLDPDFDRLWCYCKDSFDPDDACWYTKRPVGVNALNTFLPLLSSKCELSQIYTNHSLRATGATVLYQNDHSASEIMAVTGHKSVSALAVYQHTSSNQKMVMGTTLAQNVAGTSRALEPYFPRRPSGTRSHVVTAAASLGEDHVMQLTQQDLDFMFDDKNAPEETPTQHPSAAPAQPVTFKNCVFNGPVTFEH